MTTPPQPFKVFFSKVWPLPVHHTEVEDPNIRCPAELFQAKRGFEQCKLNFLTSVVESYDAEFGCQPSQRSNSTRASLSRSRVVSHVYNDCQSVPQKNETNNNGSRKDVELDKDLDSASTSNSGSGISLVGKKGKVKALRKALRRLVSKSRSNIVQPKQNF